MHKPVAAIEVRIWGQTVGAVALDPKLGYYAFEYAPGFTRSGIELAPFAMPLSGAGNPFVFVDLSEPCFKRLPAMLADALPDDFGNALIDAWMAREGIEKSKITSLDRLAYMGKRGMGALEFKPAHSLGHRSSTAIKLSGLVEIARLAVQGNLATGKFAKAALAQIIRVGTSAGGARAKAVVAWNPATNEVRVGQFDLDPGFEHWLLKLDGVGIDRELGGTKHYGRIEYAYHRMARVAGINMAPCRLLEENDRAHFMTRRFDRDGNHKHHMQSLCAMAHLDYKQRETHDYSQLFQTAVRLGLGRMALEEAFRRMAFNIMAANCDDHPKNFSFLLREGGRWELAPAYDVMHAFNPASYWLHQHLMSVNGKFSGIKRKDVMEVADRFGVGSAKHVLGHVKTVVESWPDFAREADLDDSEMQRIRKDHVII